MTEELDIINASGKSLAVLGTCKMFIENKILGGRKMVEAAVIQGDRKETLISLQLLKKWDLIHDSFPHQTISDYIVNKSNKKYTAYSMHYELHSNIYEENRKLKPPSRVCRKLREYIVKNCDGCFKEELEPHDRMKVEPLKLRLKEGYISPSFCTKPYDTPYQLREMYKREIKRSLDAGHIAPCGTEPSEGASKAFPV